MSHLSKSVGWLVAHTDWNTRGPRISNIGSPFGDLLIAPVVDIVVNEAIASSSGSVEGSRHSGVPGFCGDSLRVAIVIS